MFQSHVHQAHRHDPVAKAKRIKDVEADDNNLHDSTFKDNFEMTRTAVIMSV